MTTLQSAFTTRPCLGESKSGDAGVIVESDGGTLAAIIDGLGHGASAHGVAKEAAAFVRDWESTDVGALLLQLHEHLASSIGAAVGACHIDSRGHVHYASVGNTVFRRFGSDERRLVSQDGVVGLRMRSPRVQQMTLQPGDVALMHTDGISERFEAGDYPGLTHHAPETIVRVVIRRFGKNHDDAGCIAMRYTG